MDSKAITLDRYSLDACAAIVIQTEKFLKYYIDK